MRILRLDLSSGHSVDLHPFLTVLDHLGEPDRGEVLDAIRSLARGSTAGIRGLVQNQGLLVELDGLGLDRISASTAADVVIDQRREGDDDLSWLEAQIDQQRRRAEIRAVAVEELRAVLDPSARARVAALEERLAPVDDEEAVVRADQVGRVERAVGAVTAEQRVLVEAPAGVPELRARLRDNEAAEEALADHVATLTAAIEQAREGLGRAREALAEAEAEAVPVLLTREEEARLELLSFPAMDETRRGKWRKVLRKEEQREMEELLAKVGVESWTAYTMYRAAPVAPQARLDEAAAARAGVVEAERNLAEAEDVLASDSRYAEVKAEEVAIREAARGHLGMMLPHDLDRALEQLTVEQPNAAWSSAVAELARLLDELDVSPDAAVEHGPTQRPQPSDPSANALADDDEGRIVQAAQRWLAIHREQHGDRDLAALRGELDRARGELDRHQRAMARIGRAEAAAAEAALGLATLEEQLAARATQDPAGVDRLLSFIEPIATQVTLEARGSLPIAVVGRFTGLDDQDLHRLMARLSELAEELQFVVVAQRAAIHDWVRGVGLDRAMISKPRPTSDRSVLG